MTHFQGGSDMLDFMGWIFGARAEQPKPKREPKAAAAIVASLRPMEEAQALEVELVDETARLISDNRGDLARKIVSRAPKSKSDPPTKS